MKVNIHHRTAAKVADYEVEYVKPHLFWRALVRTETTALVQSAIWL